MPKLPLARPALAKVPGHVGSAWRFWNLFHSFHVQDIVEDANKTFHLALIGTEDQTALLAARLALETASPRDLGPQRPAVIQPYVGSYMNAAEAPSDSLRLDADLMTQDEARLAEALAKIVLAHPALQIALARRIPAFRPAVVAYLIGEASKENGRIALLSALPGVIPFTDILMPATALGDMFLLTKNQVRLLLKIAAAYGKEVDLRARTTELLPVVGSGFGWRAVTRELVGLVPGGIGMLIKGSVAYAGTYTIGKAAAIYYSTGQPLSRTRLKQLYQDALREAMARLRPLLKRRKPKPPIKIDS